MPSVRKQVINLFNCGGMQCSERNMTGGDHRERNGRTADGCEREKVWRKEPLVTTMMDEGESKSGVFVLLSLWRLQNNLQHPVRIIHSLTLTPSVTDHRQTDTGIRHLHLNGLRTVRYGLISVRPVSRRRCNFPADLMIPLSLQSSGRREGRKTFSYAL